MPSRLHKCRKAKGLSVQEINYEITGYQRDRDRVIVDVRINVRRPYRSSERRETDVLGGLMEFTIVESARAAYSTRALSSSEHSKSRRVLVVDDDDPIRSMLCYALDHAGYQAEGVDNASDAFTKICATPYEVVVLDNMMPGMTGEQLAKRLLLLGCTDRTRILMITGGSVPGDALTFARKVLMKPFEVDEFLDAVAETIGTTP